MNKARPLISVVDNEESIRKALTHLLLSYDWEVESFPSGTEFFDSLNNHRPDCVLLDLHMPGMDGFDVLARLEQSKLHVPVIIITGHDSPQARERAMSARPAAYLRKPVDQQTLVDAIELAIRNDTQETSA